LGNLFPQLCQNFVAIIHQLMQNCARKEGECRKNLDFRQVLSQILYFFNVFEVKKRLNFTQKKALRNKKASKFYIIKPL